MSRENMLRTFCGDSLQYLVSKYIFVNSYVTPKLRPSLVPLIAQLNNNVNLCLITK